MSGQNSWKYKKKSTKSVTFIGSVGYSAPLDDLKNFLPFDVFKPESQWIYFALKSPTIKTSR